jgi:hypothetical protein
MLSQHPLIINKRNWVNLEVSFGGLMRVCRLWLQTKGASSEVVTRKPGPIEREVKLKELGKMIKGFVG